MNDPMQWDALRRRNYRAEARHAPSSIALNDFALLGLTGLLAIGLLISMVR
jgi:hypothetical protein